MLFCRSDHRIVSAARKRMAAEDAGEGHPSTPQSSVAFYRFHGIFRAGRHVAASWRQQGRDRPLVDSQQLQCDEFGELAQDPLSAFRSPLPAILFVAGSVAVFPVTFCDSFCSITVKALLTSFSTTEKSVVNNDFFGLITTSAATPASGRDLRTASRKRRFMRLRCTAPPRARPTVNPTRRPWARVSSFPSNSGRAQ